jgi:2-polyprenyl-3-methyl-5-hydroxy-6-metoxy-1,4-benzoquinol methylase
MHEAATPTGTVIDFGAGTGRLTVPLLQEGTTVHAIDISEESLRRLRTLADSIGYGAHLSCASALPLSNNAHLIMGTDVLHHVDIPAAVQQFLLTLAPSGTCIFSEPNVLNPAWAVFITASHKTSWSVESGILFTNYFSLRRYFTRTKCTVTIRGFALVPPQLLGFSKTLSRINYWLGDLPILKIFAFRLIIIATKSTNS